MIFNHFKIVDLTQPLSENVPSWNGTCGFCLEIIKDYDQMFRVQQMKLHAGIGTHMDAPSHRIQDGISIADIPVEQLIVPICMIDVSDKAEANYEISVQDIQDHEAKHGLIPSNALVIAYTGWGRFWMNADAYRNMDANGQMHFPAFSAESAEFLLKRNISGIAIDTLSPDCLDPDFTVHKLILGAGKYIIENVGDCLQLPAKGSYAIALPLRVENSTESPIRIIALVPH
ncbi:MAG TPA: cyclase family protein [Waddliaceae bacterium]